MKCWLLLLPIILLTLDGLCRPIKPNSDEEITYPPRLKTTEISEIQENLDSLVWNIEALPRSLDIDNDLKEIIEARGKKRVTSITEYAPSAKFLILYLCVNFNKPNDRPKLILSLTETNNHRYGESMILIKNFGKYVECEEAFDLIRCSHFNSIEMEDSNRLYFAEFLKNCNGQQNSILKLIGEIFNCFDYYLPEKYRQKFDLETRKN